MDLTIYTIGHSTHPWNEFLDWLRPHSIELLADVRTVPKSRRNPQFNTEELARSLPAAGIAYEHMPGLGGLRHPHKDSINTAWRNDSFRGYADHMQTPDFQAWLDRLIQFGSERRTAIMCAEAVPWQCHRSLISDALLAREIRVEHIMGPAKRKPHTFTPFARVEGERVTYPGIEVV